VNALLATFARLNPQACFIQVGGAADPQRDPLQEIVLRSQWHGVVVEPIPRFADQLKSIYAPTSRVSVEQAAIASADGEQPFYYDSLSLPGPGTPMGGGSRAAGALCREILYFPGTYHADLDESVVEVVTPTLTFQSLCDRHGIERVDVLRIDTAGDEAEILAQVDLGRFRPKVIAYDHSLLGLGVRHAAIQRLAARRYEVHEFAGNTWFLCTHGLPARQTLVLRAMWRRIGMSSGSNGGLAGLPRRAVRRVHRGLWTNGSDAAADFPLTEDERRYLTNHYDHRTPLPPQAATDLANDNPQLLELRRRYASLDLPALRHHYWSAGRVADSVNLKYFRGDNLYVWHYPEHPRAMALRLVLYLRYLEGRDGRELLEMLSEDGAFGCWTTDVAGYGKISRDLLDSVNELLFLDRYLDVLTKDMRVLDIGAGYGRLAHRMAVAAPDLADYCCVDAVAESTFLAEYYLDFRGCSPPARALPLPEVPELKAGSFDLAVNVHSFSECTIEATRWWVDLLKRLQVPYLFVVPNEAEGILSREPDGSFQPVLPVLEAAGYVPFAKERAIGDRVLRDALELNENFYLFSLDGGPGGGTPKHDVG
jgi:FkbM family methyltransferase